jgi:hypothetical protein
MFRAGKEEVMTEQGREHPDVTESMDRLKQEQQEQEQGQGREEYLPIEDEHPIRFGQEMAASEETETIERQKREQQSRERTGQPESTSQSERQDRRPWWRKIFGG